MKSTRFVRTAGVAGMFGAALWVLALYIEYAYDLFQPRDGVLYAANQAMFLIGMLCFLTVIAGLVRRGGRVVREGVARALLLRLGDVRGGGASRCHRHLRDLRLSLR